jgi:hypothetical protein
LLEALPRSNHFTPDIPMSDSISTCRRCSTARPPSGRGLLPGSTSQINVALRGRSADDCAMAGRRSKPAQRLAQAHERAATMHERMSEIEGRAAERSKGVGDTGAAERHHEESEKHARRAAEHRRGAQDARDP